MNDDINDVIKKYSDDNPERNDKAREKLKKSNLEAELLALAVSEKQQYLNLRKQWSRHIKVAFWAILGSGLVFTTLLGFNILDYSKYTGLPQTIFGSFILEVIGLAWVIAKFLFPNPYKN